MSRKLTRSGAVRYADKWFSLYIRELTRQKYHVCPFCGGPIEHCFHFFSRVNYATRWLINNAIGSCAGCNMLMEYSPYKFYKWYASHWGQDLLDEVDRLHHTIAKFTTAEIIEIGDKFKKMHEDLKEIK